MHFIPARAGHPGAPERVLERDPSERDAGERTETASCRCWSPAVGNESNNRTKPARQRRPEEDGATALWTKGETLIRILFYS